MTSSDPHPCLQFTINHPEPGRVDQILAVYPDGRRELFVTAALAYEQRSRVGTFLAEPDAAIGNQAREISNRLMALDFEGQPYPRGVQWVVTVYNDNGEARSHLLSVIEHTPLPPDLQEALELGKNWMAQTAGQPYRALEISARLQASERGLRLAVTFKTAGTQPIRFLLMSGGLALESEYEGQRSEIWQLTGRPVMGMMHADGTLADGVIIPAELGAGSSVLLALRPQPQKHIHPEHPLRLLCWGWMDAPKPGEAPRSFPDVPVWLACPVELVQS